ncbi:MAG TPA: glucosamine-6-phosphate deaminase [Edaphobacter sp.]|jgi:glucosamine-6-phosphate deaminase|nr:glucosamine-6-phosphate deaminase [Edaphobacter sp.]
MTIKVFSSKATLAEAAANHAATVIRDAISQHGEARIIAATGASQFEFLDALTKITDIDWGCVEMFHLDEYVGISGQAPASFCRYLRERLIDKVGLKKYHLLDGTQAPAVVIDRVSAEIRKAPIDIAFVGVGENGHLAFNDPPADFDTEEAYIVVDLDDACRKQQLGEGWFPTLADVPRQAISMTIQQIMKAEQILCIAPDARKASAIKACFSGEISPMAPASILQTHQDATIYLDNESASLFATPPVEA